MSSLMGRTSPEASREASKAASVAPHGAEAVTFHARSLLTRSAFYRGLQGLIRDARPMRRGVGSAFAIGFMTMGLGYGAAMGGHGPIVVSALASTVGLQAQDIVITGQIETAETDVYRALGFVTNQSLIGFDADAARLRLKALPWVKDVAIRKLYPGKLTIAIAERRPMAVWQHEDRLTVVEETGRPIDRFGIADLINNRFGHLPHLVGKGASGAAADILPLVAAHPSIAQQVTSYVHVAERRWDIELAGGIRIKLPEKGVADALARAQSLNEKHALFEREIKTLDLRVKDRAIIALPEKAAKTRADFVSARQKAMKKADTKL